MVFLGRYVSHKTSSFPTTAISHFRIPGTPKRPHPLTYSLLLQRGIIFHGPPGNGKTISIRAIMKTLANRPSHPVACLYVKSFTTFDPEYGIRRVFQKARETAPCLLIFEDVDSLVTPTTRSYFLNEVDGKWDSRAISTP